MSNEVAIVGVGMHPWGKWGRPFQSYGVHAARAALADAGLDWSDVQLVVGGETVRNGYAGYVAGATFAQTIARMTPPRSGIENSRRSCTTAGRSAGIDVCGS